MKRKIDVFEYAKDITTAISKGILITTKANKINAMTIGWGSLGIEWGLPIFTAYVRTGRFTAEQLQKILNLQLIYLLVILIKKYWVSAAQNQAGILIKLRN